MNKEEFITQLDKLLPNKFGLQLKIFSLAEDYAQQQLLNKHDVSGSKELLIQMLQNENEALGKATFSELYKRETHANNKYCLAVVIQLIDERKAL